MTIRIEHLDALDLLRSLEDCSVDSLVSDPPSGISFMGKAWDRHNTYEPQTDKGRDLMRFGSALLAPWEVGFCAFIVDVFSQALRVTKPGGHGLIWALPRTSDLTALGLRVAGWEVRDSVHHIFGSGFPKSADISKAIDRQKDNRAEILQVTEWIRTSRDAAGLKNADIDRAFGFHGMAGHWTSAASQPSVPTLDQIPKLLEVLGADPSPEVGRLIWKLNGQKGKPGPNWFKREVIRTEHQRTLLSGIVSAGRPPGPLIERKITAPATPEAQRWEGWGTALKPGHEVWWLIRKPVSGTIAGNVQEWGTGGINVDGCRVGTSERPEDIYNGQTGPIGGTGAYGGTDQSIHATGHEGGRWPPNVLLTHDAECGADCVDGCPVEEMGAQSGESKSPASKERTPDPPAASTFSLGRSGGVQVGHDDTGTAARYFPQFRYSPKPSRAEREAGLDHLEEAQRDEARKEGDPGGDNPRNRGTMKVKNIHPTVKSIDLMRWLTRLVTPPRGLVLDPFVGSGTTALACVHEGFDFIGSEQSAEYVEIARARVDHADPAGAQTRRAERGEAGPPTSPEGQGRLF